MLAFIAFRNLAKFENVTELEAAFLQSCVPLRQRPLLHHLETS